MVAVASLFWKNNTPLLIALLRPLTSISVLKMIPMTGVEVIFITDVKGVPKILLPITANSPITPPTTHMIVAKRTQASISTTALWKHHISLPYWTWEVLEQQINNLPHDLILHTLVILYITSTFSVISSGEGNDKAKPTPN